MSERKTLITNNIVKGDLDYSIIEALDLQSELAAVIRFAFEGEVTERLGIYPSIYKPFIDGVSHADPELTRRLCPLIITNKDDGSIEMEVTERYPLLNKEQKAVVLAKAANEFLGRPYYPVSNVKVTCLKSFEQGEESINDVVVFMEAILNPNSAISGLIKTTSREYKTQIRQMGK